MQNRIASVNRKTKETDISLEFSLDGSGSYQIETGIGFFNHMLESFARHGFFDMKLTVKGDLHVDAHHSVEDTGIALGQAIKNALGDKVGIRRYGSSIVPMDECLVCCAVDLSGRPYLAYDLKFENDKVGDIDTELIKEFFYALSYNAGMNLHIKMLSSGNNHHMAEAAFKAFARALDEASGYDGRVKDVLSTKGTI
ncbi:MAG: imidazoleglycerol-phosphate dehydratase HisB [Clostridiales bacterium]|jgi:imidazoleglycerol-phosphate dehydratase|nr:imidazoleglycerol-phosphate dehydratase HisB [Clostridiales bacterium]